jgi:hypothetical protein
MDGCQPLISGRNTASSFGFKPLEKSYDPFTGKQTYRNPLGWNVVGFLTVCNQQFKGIPVGIHRIFADIFLGWKVHGKEFCKILCEISGFHEHYLPIPE